jgi:hypothetical protein
METIRINIIAGKIPFIDEDIQWVYKCYLGKHLMLRAGSVCDFVKKCDGETFFRKYSLPKDSVLDFIERCRKKGISI